MPLATVYRVRRLIVGCETIYTLAGSVIDIMATLRNLATGDTAQIIMQAANGRSQGVASDPIQMLIPAPVINRIELTGPTFAHDKIGRNGHANGRRRPALS